MRQTGEDREFEPQQKDVRFVWPTVDKFFISFYSPVTWEVIPNTKVELDNWENVTCMRHVSMRDPGSFSLYEEKDSETCDCVNEFTSKRNLVCYSFNDFMIFLLLRNRKWVQRIHRGWDDQLLRRRMHQSRANSHPGSDRGRAGAGPAFDQDQSQNHLR